MGIIQNYIESFETSSRNDKIKENKEQDETNKKQNQKSSRLCLTAWIAISQGL